MRDVYGRLKTAYPEINADAAAKKYVDDLVSGIVKQYTSPNYYYNGANLNTADAAYFNTNTAPIVIFTVNCEGYQSSSEERIITLMRGSNGSSSSAYVGFFAENENDSTEITYVVIKDGTIELKRDL
jgi:hypothetical protein